jgi:steroid delta-isomerase-like uncharacterized protein
LRYERTGFLIILKRGEFMKKSMRKGSVLALSGLVLCLCFSIACQDKAAMAELEKYKAQAKVEDQNIALVKRLLEEENKGNAEIVKELYAPNVKSYYPSGSKTPASQNDDFEIAKAYYTAFPDINQTIEELVASGDKVTVRLMARGTHRGDFQGIPATGNQMEIGVIVIFHIKDGKIVEEREELDSLGIMTQLGMELKPIQAKKK